MKFWYPREREKGRDGISQRAKSLSNFKDGLTASSIDYKIVVNFVAWERERDSLKLSVYNKECGGGKKG